MYHEPLLKTNHGSEAGRCKAKTHSYQPAIVQDSLKDKQARLRLIRSSTRFCVLLKDVQPTIQIACKKRANPSIYGFSLVPPGALESPAVDFCGSRCVGWLREAARQCDRSTTKGLYRCGKAISQESLTCLARLHTCQWACSGP